MPDYVAVNKEGSVIFVSDCWTSTIIVVTAAGSILFQYKTGDLKNCRGLHVVLKRNILACGFDTDNVQFITSTGKKYKNLLESADGIMDPEGIAFRPSDGTLVVGCRRVFILE